MEAKIYYNGKLYSALPMEIIDSEHPNMQPGDKFDIEGKEVLVTEITYLLDKSVVEIYTVDM